MPRQSANCSRGDAGTSSERSSSGSSSGGSDDDVAFGGRRKRKPKLSLRRLKAAVSASVERAPPHHRDRAALEVAELLLQAYGNAKKEVRAEISRLAFSFYRASPFSLPPSSSARRELERAAAGVLPDARRKSFLRAVRDAAIAEKRGSGSGLFLSPGLFDLVPDVVRHLAGFLAPVDALAAAGVCES